MLSSFLLAAVLTLGPAPSANPRRIVTLAPSLTEIVLSLGAGEGLVGVTRYDDDPRVAKLPRVGGYSDPSAETILALHPDLLVAQPSPGNRGVVEVLARLGVSVVAYQLNTVADVQETVRAMGALLARKVEAEQIAAEISAHRERVRARVAKLSPVRALLVLGTAPLVVAGQGSFAGELLADAGADNVAGESAVPFPTIAAERAVALSPNVILVAPDAAESLRLPPGLSRARVVQLASPAILRPGPRLGEALDEIDEALHPHEKK